MSKSLTVKDLAAKYGVSANLIAAELVRQGVKVDKAEKTKIPEDMTDLIESFFDDLYGQQDEEALLPKGGKRAGAPKKGNSRREEVVPKDNHRKGADSSSEQDKSAGTSGNTITLSAPDFRSAWQAYIALARVMDKRYPYFFPLSTHFKTPTAIAKKFGIETLRLPYKRCFETNEVK